MLQMTTWLDRYLPDYIKFIHFAWKILMIVLTIENWILFCDVTNDDNYFLLHVYVNVILIEENPWQMSYGIDV